jgi:hypothetical protein
MDHLFHNQIPDSLVHCESVHQHKFRPGWLDVAMDSVLECNAVACRRGPDMSMMHNAFLLCN